ncbi:MAG: winged helix-turn-helix domain-containing protein [Nitrosotalea sp.]
MKLQRHERRNKLELHYSILHSIIKESKSVDFIRPTRIQFLSNLSYDTMSNHLQDLKEKKLINHSKGITITKKGEQFVKDYEIIQKLIKQISIDYL